MSSFFLIRLKSSVFLSAWAPFTSYVSPAPASCHALTWLAGGIWALYSAFAARVFLVRRGTSIQCQILCVVSSTLLLLFMLTPFFCSSSFFFFASCAGRMRWMNGTVLGWRGRRGGFSVVVFPWGSRFLFNLFTGCSDRLPALVYNFF